MRSLIWRWWGFAKKRQIKNHAELTSYTVVSGNVLDHSAIWAYPKVGEGGVLSDNYMSPSSPVVMNLS